MGDTPTGTGTAVTRVFLLDDHEVVRRGIRDLLEPSRISSSSARHRRLIKPWPAGRRCDPT